MMEEWRLDIEYIHSNTYKQQQEAAVKSWREKERVRVRWRETERLCYKLLPYFVLSKTQKQRGCAAFATETK